MQGNKEGRQWIRARSSSRRPSMMGSPLPFLLPGLLVLGATIDEVLSRARASIAFHARAPENGQLKR